MKRPPGRKETNEYLRQLKQIVIHALHGKNIAVYLFGSFARGEMHNGSDIDIAIEIKEEKSNQSLLSHLREVIEESCIPHVVDIVDLSTVSKEFYAEIMKEAQVWID